MSKTKTTNPAGYEAPFGITADPVVFTVIDGNLAVLLAKRTERPDIGAPALPGGFVGRRESSRETVVRKLKEKTGLPPIYAEQLGFYDDPDRDARGWVPSSAYVALVPAQLLPDQGERADAGWHLVQELPTLPFDHGRMVADGLERLRGKLWYSNVAVGLLAPKFSMREAAVVYSAIAGRDYSRHMSNFSRDLLRTKLVRATGERGQAAAGGGPPPQLYEFTSYQPAWAPTYAVGTVASSHFAVAS